MTPGIPPDEGSPDKYRLCAAMRGERLDQTAVQGIDP
jgi:hypothetical protein